MTMLPDLLACHLVILLPYQNHYLTALLLLCSLLILAMQYACQITILTIYQVLRLILSTCLQHGVLHDLGIMHGHDY